MYEAQQEAPVKRRVAIKLVKWGMSSDEVLARFASERQALALMSHPNIARVYDAGAAEDGRPYFAMEHVPGVPITAYCDTHRLSVEERLGLFIQVCHGVQHAHQKGGDPPGHQAVERPGDDRGRQAGWTIRTWTRSAATRASRPSSPG